MSAVQITHLLFLSVLLWAVISLVRSRRISERYGVFLLGGLFLLAANALFFQRVFFLQDTVLNFLTGAACFIMVAFVVAVAVMMTQYSMERRQSIQQLALLCFDFEQLKNSQAKERSHHHEELGVRSNV